MPLLIRKARRKFAELDAHDVAHRISAYTYGNFLVLAALLSVYDANAIFDGTAILYITGTGLTTYIAHVIAEMQEYRVLHGGTPPREFVKHALGNASPILGTTVYPVLLLILAAILPPGATYEIILTTLFSSVLRPWCGVFLASTSRLLATAANRSAGVPSEALCGSPSPLLFSRL